MAGWAGRRVDGLQGVYVCLGVGWMLAGCGWLGGLACLPARVRACVRECIWVCVSVGACYVFAGVSLCVLGDRSVGVWVCGCACVRLCFSLSLCL